MEGPTQVVGGSTFAKLWPELIHYLLAVLAMIRGEEMGLRLLPEISFDPERASDFVSLFIIVPCQQQ